MTALKGKPANTAATVSTINRSVRQKERHITVKETAPLIIGNVIVLSIGVNAIVRRRNNDRRQQYGTYRRNEEEDELCRA